MTQKVAEELLSRVADLLTEQTGLFFPPKRWPDLTRGLAAAARDLGCAYAEQCARQLLAAPLTRKQIEVLASFLTVGETYFFREKQSLAALEDRILPGLIRHRRQTGRRLRIWSVGCASGEEAYTIAILLHRLIADLDSWQIHLLATDINTQALKKAVLSHYGTWSFRNTPPEIMEHYFIKGEHHWEILPRLRRLVQFAYLNLAQDPYPSLVNQTNAMDLILCRNVLMYFSPGQARKVLENLARCLVEGGWLLGSLTETSILRFAPLEPVTFPDVTVYLKDSRHTPKIEEAACPTFLPAGNIAPPTTAGPETLQARDRQPVQPRPKTPPPEVPRQSPEAATASAAQAEPHPGPLTSRVQEMVGLARNCAGQGDLAAALSWCEQAVAADRLNPSWHYLRAAILQEQDAVAEAAVALRHAIYLDQDFVMAHFAMGHLALRQANRRAARKHFENVLALLDAYQPEEPLRESEGITAGRLKEIVLSTMTIRKLEKHHGVAG
jgi:chemotaxis protein methyltransferase CheR